MVIKLSTVGQLIPRAISQAGKGFQTGKMFFSIDRTNRFDVLRFNDDTNYSIIPESTYTIVGTAKGQYIDKERGVFRNGGPFSEKHYLIEGNFYNNHTKQVEYSHRIYIPARVLQERFKPANSQTEAA